MEEAGAVVAIWAAVAAFAAAALAWLAFWKISRAIRPFMAGPPEAAAADMADALAERQAGERKWRSF